MHPIRATTVVAALPSFARAIFLCIHYGVRKSRIAKSPSAPKLATSQGDAVAPLAGGALSPLTPTSQPPPDGSSTGNPTNGASGFPVGDVTAVSVPGDSSISSSESSLSQYWGIGPAGRMEGVPSRNDGEIHRARSLFSTFYVSVVFVSQRCNWSATPIVFDERAVHVCTGFPRYRLFTAHTAARISDGCSSHPFLSCR